MAYTRKTQDEWQIEQYTGSPYGWEEVCSESSWKEAKERLKEYRKNQPEYPVRAKKVRTPLSPENFF